MIEFIVKYWLEVLFGLIAAGIGFWAKRYIKLEKAEMKRKQEEMQANMCSRVIETFDEKLKEVDDRSTEADKKMGQDIEELHDDIDNLQIGVLSLQGKQFKELCRELLQPERAITVDDFELFNEEYTAYKALGGNHRGDTLAEAVRHKFDLQTLKEE